VTRKEAKVGEGASFLLDLAAWHLHAFRQTV
jgi:hypothetical protein